MRFNKEQCSEMIRKESINRAATLCEFEATLKKYEAALLLGQDSADKYRAIAHDLVDALMDGQVRSVNVVKNTDFN